MVTVASLGVKIGADLKDFQKGMAQMEGQLKQVGQNLRSVGATLSRSVTLPILGIAGAAVKAASDVEEMRDKFNVVFKTVGGSVSKELGNFAEQVNRSRYDLMGFAATFGDIIKPMGFTEESAANMSVTLTKLAVDLSSFNNMPMDEAVRRLRGTLIGAHENAADFGVIINENTLKQELMRMGADKLTGAQKEQAKVQARLNLLLAGTTDAHGNAADTSGTFAGQMRGLAAATKDLGIQVGEMLLPYATELVGIMRGLVERFEAMSPEAKKVALALVGLAAAIGPALFILGGMAAGFSAIIGAMGSLVALANPVVLAFAAIAAIGIAVYRNWDAVTSAFKGTYTAITDLVTNLKDNFVSTMSGIFKAVSLAMQGDFTEAWETLKTTASTGATDVVSDLSTFATDAGAAVAPLVTALTIDPFQIDDFFEEGLAAEIANFLTGAKNNAKQNLDTGEDSVSKSATAAKDALAKIRTEVGHIEALAPSFKTLDDALSGSEVSAEDVDTALTDISTKVSNIEALAPSFATLRNSLGQGEMPATSSLVYSAMRAGLGIKGIGDEVAILEKTTPNLKTITDALNAPDGSIASHANEAKGAVKELYDLIPSELSMPEGYEDILDIIPDANETHRWSKFVSGMGTLEEDIKEASGFSFQFAGYIGDIETAWGKLVPKSAPKWMQDLSTYATDAALVVAGLESMVTLLQPATWTQAIATIGKLAAGLAGIVAALAPAIGAGIAIYSIARLFGIGDSEKPWERMGITQEEWEQMNIESGANAAFISNLMGPGADLSWLTNPSGEMPAWLQGLQNYQSGNSGSGTFGGLPTFGGMLSTLTGQNVSGDMATMGSTQTININLDGQQIATATVPYMAGELELYGTNY